MSTDTTSVVESSAVESSGVGSVASESPSVANTEVPSVIPENAGPDRSQYTGSPRSRIIQMEGPCSRCNMSLQTGTIIVAFIGLALGLLLLITGITVLVMQKSLVDRKLIALYARKKRADTESFADALGHSNIINVLRGFYYLIFYSLLAIAAHTAHRCLLILWLVVQTILTILLILGSTLVSLTDGHAYLPMLPLLLLLPELYFLWVTLAYIEELRVTGATVQPKDKGQGGANDGDMTTGKYGEDADKDKEAGDEPTFPQLRKAGSRGSIGSFDSTGNTRKGRDSRGMSLMDHLPISHGHGGSVDSGKKKRSKRGMSIIEV